MRLYLGCTNVDWLKQTSVPLFVQRGPLSSAGIDRLGRARGPWALDSGGFTEIGSFGHWTVSAEEYAREVRFWQREIGNLEWAAPQDWMCEPPMLLRALLHDGDPGAAKLMSKNWKTKKPAEIMSEIKGLFMNLGVDVLIGEALEQEGLAEDGLKEVAVEVGRRRRELDKLHDMLRRQVCVHQQRTIDNFLDLQRSAPEVRWAPVLQGWEPKDYVAHAEAYERAGVDLNKAPIVGLGSVCRRDKLDTAQAVVTQLTGGKWKLRLHGFGLKKTAFKDPILMGGLVSTDSLAWSDDARKTGWSDGPEKGLQCGGGAGHTGGKKCNNCFKRAMQWRGEAVEQWERTMFQHLGEGRRKAANPSDEASIYATILSKIVLQNLRRGKYIRSAGGKAEYMVSAADANWIDVTRLSTGRGVRVPTRRVVETAVRLLSGERIPVRGISFTVAIEAVIVEGLEGLIDIDRGEYFAADDSIAFSGLLKKLRREVAGLGKRRNEPARVAGRGGARWWTRRNPEDLEDTPTILYKTGGDLYVDPADAAQDGGEDVREVMVADLDLRRLTPDTSGELQAALDGEPEVVEAFGGRADARDYDGVESLRIVGRASYA